jgi:hypothetical protein
VAGAGVRGEAERMSRRPPEATAMRTIVIPSERPAPAAPPPRRGSRRRETVLFLVAIALIALHVIDDNFLQPQPGTSAGDHLAAGSCRSP